MCNTSCCFVPGCSTGYRSDRKKYKDKGERYFSLFVPPKDDEIFEQWQKNISREDKELTRRHRVCERHFHEEEIERFYITKLSNGSLHKFERGRASLKPGSVPTIFPKLSDQLNGRRYKRKRPKVHVVTKNNKPCTYSKETHAETIVEETNSAETIVEETDSVETTVLHTEEQHDASDKIYHYVSLLDKIESVKLPDQWWGVKQTPRYIVFTRWNDDYDHEKRIVIDELLNATVFIKDLQVGCERVISSLKDVSDLVFEVDKYLICAGIHDESMENCVGYVCKRSRGRTPIWCEKCCIRRKSKVEVMRQQFVRIQKGAADNKLEPMGYSRTSFCRLKDEISTLRSSMEKIEQECEDAAIEAEY